MNEIKKITPPILEDKDLNQLADSIAHLVGDGAIWCKLSTLR